MSFNMIEFCRVLECRVFPVEVLQPAIEIGIIMLFVIFSAYILIADT